MSTFRQCIHSKYHKLSLWCLRLLQILKSRVTMRTSVSTFSSVRSKNEGRSVVLQRPKQQATTLLLHTPLTTDISSTSQHCYLGLVQSTSVTRKVVTMTSLLTVAALCVLSWMHIYISGIGALSKRPKIHHQGR